MGKVKSVVKPSKPIAKSKPASKTLNKTLGKKKIHTNKLGKKRKSKEKEERGVVYLSHIPHGFYEKEIKDYFKQFGKVTGIALPRSKTGNSKGYAFIEFLHPEVAQIAAESMNNYLMFNRLLKAKYLPPNEQKPHFIFRAQKSREAHTTVPEKAAKNIEKNRTLKNRLLPINLEAKKARQLLQRNEAMKRKLKDLGADYEFEVKKGNLESVFEKEEQENKKKKLQDLAVEKGNVSSEDEEDLSSIEGDVDLSDEDQVIEFLSPEEFSEEEEEEETQENTSKHLSKGDKKTNQGGETKKSKKRPSKQAKRIKKLKLKTEKPYETKNENLTLTPNIPKEEDQLMPLTLSKKKSKLSGIDSILTKANEKSPSEKSKKSEKLQPKTQMPPKTKNKNPLLTSKTLREDQLMPFTLSKKKSKLSSIDSILTKTSKKQLNDQSKTNAKLQSKLGQLFDTKNENVSLTSTAPTEDDDQLSPLTLSKKNSNLSSTDSKVTKQSRKTKRQERRSEETNGLLSEPASLGRTPSTLPEETKSLKPKLSNHERLQKCKEILSLVKTPQKKSKTPVMEVDQDDEEIDFKTPPNVAKKVLKRKADSVKITLKENNKAGLNIAKQRKPRHRKLNRSQ